jgi:hypothetical protein
MAVDDKFYDRADTVIYLANAQCKEIGRGKVSASLMYATARFNSWHSARGFESGQEMKDAKKKTIEYFVKEYRAMLEENLDDCIENFTSYMKTGVQ